MVSHKNSDLIWIIVLLCVICVFPPGIFKIVFYIVAFQKFDNEDLPGSPVTESSAANAWDMGSILDVGRFYMPVSNKECVQQLQSPHSQEPVLCNKRSHHNEKPVHLY